MDVLLSLWLNQPTKRGREKEKISFDCSCIENGKFNTLHNTNMPIEREKSHTSQQ